MKTWKLIYDGFDPSQEGVREALCALGNGLLTTRGSGPEVKADDIHYPGTYVAGGYNRLYTDLAGRSVQNEDLVNIPNWLCLNVRPEDGDWFNLMGVEILSFRQELDLKVGVLERAVHFRDREGRETRIETRRLVHMGMPHLAALQMTVTPENWSGRLEVSSALDGRVINAGVQRYRQLNSKHLEHLETKPLGEDGMCLVVQTNHSHVRIAEAARTRIFRDGHLVSPYRRTVEDRRFIAQEVGLDVTEGEPIVMEKVAAIYTSRDHAVADCGWAARRAAAEADRFDSLLDGHARTWDKLWSRCSITMGQGGRTELILRLHIFHLLQTLSINTIEQDVGVPARGLHGEAYRGHVFWDEVFVCPFFSLRVPQIARSMLLYRYRRLDAARRNARQAGFQGAMFPWQSGSDGREESQELHLNPRSGRWFQDNSRLQRHVNSAIAYNVWKYYQITGDMEFLSFYGAEVILEIARFWASVATYNEEHDRYEILGVMGPDEYHDAYPDAKGPGLDNNAYTNVMAVWVLCRALDVLELLSEGRYRELCVELGLNEAEIAEWDRISRKMRVVFHDDGIISQFAGYGDLEELDWDGYREKYGDIQRLDRILEAEGDSPNRYKASKQADVLMLFYLFTSEELATLFERLGYPFEYETIPRNVDYYVRRTCHGSTLSRVVHSWVLARSDRDGSWKFFKEALESDVSDVQGGTTNEGIHLGAMAGTVDLVQRGYTGIDARDDVLWLNPCLPRQLESLHFRICYRGHRVNVEITGQQLRVTALKSNVPPVRIGFKGKVHRLKAGDSLAFVTEGTSGA